ALTAAVYTQPYAASVGLALVLWSVTTRDRKGIAAGITGLALAGFAYLPWFLWSKSRWAASIVHDEYAFVPTAKTGLMIFRELVGAGYWGSGLLLLLCAASFTIFALPSRPKNLLGLLILIPLLVGFGADAWFGY